MGVTVKLAELTEHLGCAICRGILRDAHTIPDCLHSFCKSCIYRHFLVKGSCICPKCNKTLSSRPITTLIADQKLQDVVDRIFPEFKQQEVIQEKEFYAKNKFKLKDESATEHQNGPNRPSSSPKTSSSRGRSKNSASTKQSTKPSNNGSSTRQLTIEVYPQQTNANTLPTLKFPFMQVSGNLKMSELRKLIHKRLKLSDDLQLEMACMGTTVGPELSANFILRTIWQHQNQKEPLVLHYRHMTA
ncbi:Polycomb group RING finger protein 3 [Phytophthora citrophthora]|uniref:Polycomb group RING finger protein 3 n=1 Tax=Phytophthora citrophthora TaxID=4793 RepID=A0AAD9GUI1_9STRA|nr:Polycomb group RING finger protein 3 [Phytophthora citrophthora]